MKRIKTKAIDYWVSLLIFKMRPEKASVLMRDPYCLKLGIYIGKYLHGNNGFLHNFFLFFLPPPPLGISGLFRLLCSSSYSWSLTFTSAESPLLVLPDFDLRRNHAGAHGTYSWMHTFWQIFWCFTELLPNRLKCFFIRKWSHDCVPIELVLISLFLIWMLKFKAVGDFLFFCYITWNVLWVIQWIYGRLRLTAKLMI